MMRKHILYIFLIISLGFNSYLQAQKTVTVSTEEQVFTIDGKSDDWPDELFQIPKSDYYYFIQTKNDRLILGLAFADPILQEQILISGFTLWINEKGKKKEVLGIRYPLGFPKEQIPTDPGILRERRQQLKEDSHPIVSSFQHLELINFYGEGEATWGESKNPEGIVANVNLNKAGKLIYEISIPLDIIFKDQAKLSSPKSKGFVLGFAAGTLGRPTIQGDMSVGIKGGSLSNPAQPESNWERNMQKLLEEYRAFTLKKEAWTQKFSLPRE